MSTGTNRVGRGNALGRPAAALLAVLCCAPVRGQQPTAAAVPTIAAGAHHTCALTAAGEVFCWGANDAGQAGGSGSAATSPHPVAGIQFGAIASGGRHTCGLDTAGSAWCWGANEFGQLGDGRGASTARPRRVVGSLHFASITAGGTHTCALTASDQRAFCWGDQWDRAAGTFAAGENLREPLPVRGNLSFRSLSAGGQHTCGVDRSGRLFCWGDNTLGQVRPDRGDRSFYQPEPVPVGSAVFTTVAAGAAHTCALATDGRVYCWGSNRRGQLGPGNGEAPAGGGWLKTDLRFERIAAGGDHSCGVTTAAQVVCWGEGQDAGAAAVTGGQQPLHFHPVSSPGPDRTFAQVTSGLAHDCAASTAGEIWCWGDDRMLQLGGPRPGNGEAVRVALPGR